MNQGTTIQLTADVNGDLTLSNGDGTITVRKDGTIVISSLAPIHLVGESLGKLDTTRVGGMMLAPNVQGFLNLLQRRGKKP